MKIIYRLAKNQKYTIILKTLKSRWIQNYSWDDTKRAKAALFSLWSLLKRKILQIGQKV